MAGKYEQETDDPVYEASLESFPANDPPGWVPLRIGAVDVQELLKSDRAARGLERSPGTGFFPCGKR